MLRRRFLDRFLFPALVVAACGGESSDLFDSSGAPTGRGGGDDSGGEGPELSGGKLGATGGGNGGGTVTPTGGRSSAGATSGGSGEEGGEPSGGTASGGRTGNGGRVGNGGRMGNGGSTGGGAVGGENQGGAGSASGGVANGGAHQGGVTAVGGKASCTDSDAADQNQRGTTKGSNGTFEDECDGDDQVEYVCEVLSTPGPCAASMSSSDADLRPAPPIENCQVPTGKVIEHTVACDRGCRDGSCFYWCPTLEDEVLVERRGRDLVELTNLRTDDVYSCEVTFESENFDCRGSSDEGQTFPVSSLTCGLETLILSVDSEDAPGVVACSYSCSYE